MIKRKYTQQQGLTLIELLVAMTLTVILAGAVIGLQFILSKNREVAISNFYSVESANTNLSVIAREIRTARVSSSGSYPLVTAADNELIFFSDRDFDGDVERVRYTLTDNVLERGIIEPVGQPVTYPLANESIKTMSDLVRNEGQPMFEYYNGDWPVDTVNNPLATPPSISEVKLIRIYLKLITNDADPSQDYVLDSYTAIRMLKDNL